MKTQKNVYRSAAEDMIIWIILLLFVIEHIYIFLTCGLEYNIGSDDLSYIKAGIRFAETGEITMHGVLTAQIMPGMPVLIGCIVAVLGQGKAMWTAVKLLWMLFGCGTVLCAYHSAALFVKKRFAAIACLIFLTPDIAGLDSIPLSDTPYMFFLSLSLFLTMYAGKFHSKAALTGMLVAVLFGLMIRLNIMPFVCIAVLYLILKRYPINKLAVRLLVWGVCLSFLLVPWVIRNYRMFGDYIVSYAAYNPMYVGTMQGSGFPDDSEIDYSEEKAVLSERAEVYLKSHPERDQLPDYLQRYYDHIYNRLQAKKRIRVWFEKNPSSLLVSYAVKKPLGFIKYYRNYAQNVFHLISERHYRIYHCVCFALCGAAVFIGLQRNLYRLELLLLGGTYLLNVIVFSMGVIQPRYEIPLTAFKSVALAFFLFFVCATKEEKTYIPQSI